MKKILLSMAAALTLSLSSNAQTQMLHYDFSNPTSGILNDLSGNGINGFIYGTSISAAAGMSGAPNTALLFDGASTWGDVPADARLSLREWTISATVMFNQFNNNSGDCQVTRLVERGSQGFNDYYCLEVNDNNIDNSCVTNTINGKQFFGVASGTGPAYNSYPKSPRLATGVWYCLTSTFANDTIKAYINGSLIYTKYWLNQYPRPFISALALRIGRTTSFSNPYRFNGIMDDMQIWDGALTQTQIQNMCGTVPPPVSGLCSIDDIEFSSSLSTPFTYKFTPSITVGAGLPPMNIRWSWGDGSPATFSVDSTPILHTFPSGGGNYYICAMTTAPCFPAQERCFQMCLNTIGAKPGAGNGTGIVAEVLEKETYDMGVGNPYPNPTNAILNIPVQNLKGRVKIVVTSINGAVMLSRESDIKESTSVLEVNTDKLAPGIYLLEVSTGGNKVTKRFSKI